MPRFHVKETFAINDKATFVLSGFVIEGEVRSGMAVSIPFNAKIKMTTSIDRVEIVRRPDGDVVCLCLDCSDPNEVALWEALNLKNRVIEVILPRFSVADP